MACCIKCNLIELLVSSITEILSQNVMCMTIPKNKYTVYFKVRVGSSLTAEGDDKLKQVTGFSRQCNRQLANLE